MKPKVFLSSTCYDLSVVRAELDKFFTERGFEVLNSESPSFGVDPGKHSHSACLSAVKEADYLVLIIGKRRGGTFIGSEASITNEEFNAAQDESIPCIVCVDRAVNDYRQTYKRNPNGDHTHIVDDKRIFHFIDFVSSGHTDNWLHPYSTVQELREILTTQFAHYLRTFSRNCRPTKDAVQTQAIVGAFPESLTRVERIFKSQDEQTAMRNGLLEVHRLISSIQSSEAKPAAKEEKLKQLWTIARYGEVDFCRGGNTLTIDADNFSQYAWSVGRGRRVNQQFADLGVSADYEFDGDANRGQLVMSFKPTQNDTQVAWALQEYVRLLLRNHPEKDALGMFKRADFQCFQ